MQITPDAIVEVEAVRREQIRPRATAVKPPYTFDKETGIFEAKF